MLKRICFALMILVFTANLIIAKTSVEPKVIIRSDDPNFKDAIVITVDMCPSSKRYDKRLFEYLDKLGRKRGKPIPVAIAASGKWVTGHVDELEEIRKMFLDITWVNHSYSHPIEEGFLLNSKVNFTAEVEEATIVFRKHHLKTSRFFRFPGLKHDLEHLKLLSEMGYIALDADAWLGKGQSIEGGSIVLVHCNGNESPGVIDRLLGYLQSHEAELLKDKFRIVSIEAFAK